MNGDLAPALALMERLHHAGADPAELLIELAEFCHFVTRVKLAPSGSTIPRQRDGARGAAAISPTASALGPLTRAWQILLKGVQDVKDLPRPLASAEMALIRLGYAADLPTPEDALRKLAEAARRARAARRAAAAPPLRAGGARAPARAARSTPVCRAFAASAAAPRRRAAAGALRGRGRAGARQARHPAFAGARDRCAAGAFRAGRIDFSLVEGASPEIAQTLSRRLREWTGERWMVALVAGRDRADPARDRLRRARASASSGAGQSAGARSHGALPRRARSSTCAAPMRRRPPRRRRRRRRGRLRRRARRRRRTFIGARHGRHHGHDEKGAGHAGQAAGRAGGPGAA